MDINLNQKSQISPFIVGSEENKMIRQAENINASWKYRRYLQNNAKTIMDYNKTIVLNEFNNANYYTNDQNSANIPFLYNSCLENTKPFGYENSDLKQAYLAKVQAKTMKQSPEIHLSLDSLFKKQ